MRTPDPMYTLWSKKIEIVKIVNESRKKDYLAVLSPGGEIGCYIFYHRDGMYYVYLGSRQLFRPISLTNLSSPISFSDQIKKTSFSYHHATFLLSLRPYSPLHCTVLWLECFSNCLILPHHLHLTFLKLLPLT